MKLTPINNPVALRRDITVGTRIFAGDVMIFGDTGDLDLSGNLGEGIQLKPSVGMARIRRVNHLVTISLRIVITGNIPVPNITIPDGFRAASYVNLGTHVSSTGSLVRINVLGSFGRLDFTRSPASSQEWGSADGIISTEFSYTTNNAWPTRLNFPPI